jgi:hypothetical protein
MHAHVQYFPFLFMKSHDFPFRIIPISCKYLLSIVGDEPMVAVINRIILIRIV